MPAALVENSQVICEVWASNLEEEMRKIREIVLSYSYIAMDTEFPGVVVRPIGEFRSSIDYQYQLLRCNVDLLKIIQLGLTFTNEKENILLESTLGSLTSNSTLQRTCTPRIP